MTGQGAIIMFRNLGNERCNDVGMDENLLQNIVFQSFFALFLDLSRYFESERQHRGGCMFLSQTGKITPQNPLKPGNFPSLALFSTCPTLKSRLSTSPPHKNYIFEITKDMAIIFIKFGYFKLMIVNCGSI